MPSDEHTLTLQEIAAECRLPYTQKELLKLARRYDRLGGRGVGP